MSGTRLPRHESFPKLRPSSVGARLSRDPSEPADRARAERRSTRGPGENRNVTAERKDLEALRLAVFRPGATAEDRARYAEARGPEDGGAGPGAPVAARRRRRRALAIPAIVLVLCGTAAAIGVLARPAAPPYPTVASTPIPVLGDDEARLDARRDLAALFDEPKPFLGLYLAQHRTALSASIRSDSIAVDGEGTGRTTVSLRGITTPGQATGLLTVLLTCDRPARYSWVLSGSGAASRTGGSGDDCSGAIVTATFVPRPHHVPTRIRIDVPAGVRTIVEVDLSRY